MATSLRDIPGAGRRSGKRSQRDPWQALPGGQRPAVLLDPRGGLGRPGRRGAPRGSLFDRGRGPRLTGFDLLLILGSLAVVAFLASALWGATRVDIAVTATSDGEVLPDDLDGQALTAQRAATLAVAVEVEPADRLQGARLSFDGEPLQDFVGDDGVIRWESGGPLSAGEHRLLLTVPRPVLPESTFSWTFVVDPTPPRLKVPDLLEPRAIDEPLVIRGEVDVDASVTANGDEVDVDEDGRFELTFERPPAGPIRVDASDAAGHHTVREIFVPIERPVVRGVHMTAISWRTKELRDPVFQLIEEGKINTVELDLKDEGGEVGYDSEVPLARDIGAVRGYYDLEEAVKELKDRGVRVIGRLVAFRDPILADAAWQSGQGDWVLQTADGQPHPAYGGFTNFAHPDVQRYNIDIALEAVEAGVDEILWDYIRRPEGPLEEIRFPGLEPHTPETGVAAFMERTHDILRRRGVLQGASVFGIAADRPAAIGQNVPLLARNVDYLSPMVYPSLWVSGEYRVPDPVNMPYEIVKRSMADFMEKADGTGVGWTPWLQDFSLGRQYGDAEVLEQLKAVDDLGIRSWLLWSPRVRYHAGLVPRME
jgi:hypothetical protein